jgi:disulfide oxidoreductase YuzD
MIRVELERRYGDSARIDYIDVTNDGSREGRDETVRVIHDRNLVWPVTVVDGQPLYDGAVSYPAILRAVDSRLSATDRAEA